MRKRNRLMAALAAAAAVSLSVIVPATAASAAPPDSWAAIGQVSNSGTCADNVATFTVSVPTVGIDAEMQGGFSVNGASLNVENYAVGVISPFTRSVTVPVDTFPSTFTVSYWLNTTAETLFVNVGGVQPALRPATRPRRSSARRSAPRSRRLRTVRVSTTSSTWARRTSRSRRP